MAVSNQIKSNIISFIQSNNVKYTQNHFKEKFHLTLTFILSLQYAIQFYFLVHFSTSTFTGRLMLLHITIFTITTFST